MVTPVVDMIRTEIAEKMDFLQLEYLQQITEKNPISIVITNVKGEILYVNKQFVAITGYSYQELIGNNPRVLNSGYFSQEDYKQLWGTILVGKTWKGIFRNKKKSGEFYWEKAIIFPVFDDVGHILYFIGMKEDITENVKNELALKESEKNLQRYKDELEELVKQRTKQLYESENRLKLALFSGNQGIWDWKLNIDYLYINEEWKLRNGIQQLYQTNTGNDWQNIIYPDDYHLFKEELNLFLIRKSSGLKVECRIQTSASDIRWFLITSNYIEYDKNGNPSRLIGILQDITLQKQSEFEIARAKEQAEMLEKLKSSFIASISHEVRTPLNGIMGFLSLVGNKNISHEKRSEYIKIVKSCGEQLVSIIDDLLNISRIQSGELFIKKSAFTVYDLLQEIYGIYKPIADEKNIDLKISGDKNSVIYSDYNKIRQILIYLLNNAVKYTQTGYIHVGYKAGINNTIAFFVEDTGIGIKQENLNEIFTMFHQLDSGLSRQYNGTGLGLSIVKGYTELLGGKVTVNSEPGKGSTFIISILNE